MPVRCEACAFVLRIDMSQVRLGDFYECTYRPPATLRSVVGITERGDALNGTAGETNVRVQPDDWCHAFVSRE